MPRPLGLALIAALVLGLAAAPARAQTAPAPTPAPAAPVATVGASDPVRFGEQFFTELKAKKWQADPDFIDRWFAPLPAARMKRDLKERSAQYPNYLMFSTNHAGFAENGPQTLKVTLETPGDAPVIAFFDEALPDNRMIFKLAKRGTSWRINEMKSEEKSSLRAMFDLKSGPAPASAAVIGPPPETPEAFARRVLNDAYAAARANHELTDHKSINRYFARDIANAILKDRKAGDNMRLDFDPILNAQDVDQLKNVNTRLIGTIGDQTRVEITWEMFGKATAYYTLVPTRDGWRLRDVEHVNATDGEYLFELQLPK